MFIVYYVEHSGFTQIDKCLSNVVISTVTHVENKYGEGALNKNSYYCQVH